MTCEKAEELLSAYLDDTLAPHLSQEVAAHVEGCASCREILADYRRADASITPYLQTSQIEPPAYVRERLFDSAEYAAILKHAAEAEESKTAERSRTIVERPRRAAAPPGWARGALAAAIAVIVFGSALLIKQGLLHSGTPSAHNTTVLNGNTGTQPLAAGARVLYKRGDVLWSVLASGAGSADQLTPQSIRVGAWSVAPDGRSVAYVDLATGLIHVIRSDDQNDLATGSLSITTADAPLVWSPDGQRIAYLAATSGNSSTLRIVNVDGSNDLAVYDARYDASGVSGAPVWSGDAVYLAFVEQRATGQMLSVYNTATKVSRELSSVDPSGLGAALTMSGLRWLNDPANPRVTWAVTNGAQITGVYAVSAVSGGVVSQTSASARLDAANVSWSPDAGSAAFVTSTGHLMLWMPSSGATLLTSAAGISGTPVWSADGQRVAVASSGDVLLVNVFGGAVQRVSVQGTTVNIAFTPDGAGLAVATVSGVTVYVDSTTSRAVLGAAENGAIAWSVAG